MDILFSITVFVWVVFVAIALLFALFRMLMTHGDYTVLHVRRSELAQIPEQVVMERRLERIDFWGQLTAALALIYGLVLAIVYVYFALEQMHL